MGNSSCKESGADPEQQPSTAPAATTQTDVPPSHTPPDESLDEVKEVNIIAEPLHHNSSAARPVTEGGWVVEKSSRPNGDAASMTGKGTRTRLASQQNHQVQHHHTSRHPEHHHHHHHSHNHGHGSQTSGQSGHGQHGQSQSGQHGQSHGHHSPSSQHGGQSTRGASQRARGDEADMGSVPGAVDVDEPNVEAALETLMNGSRASGYSLFARYDKDQDGHLSRTDLQRAFLELRLNLSAESYSQFVHCNFVYADRDRDGLLNFNDFMMLYCLICDMRKKFKRYDLDQDGYINKKDFTNIVTELNLNLDQTMLQNYVNLNFRYADRGFKGTISFGQFLTGYANFLYSYEVTASANKIKNNGASSTQGGGWQAAEGDVLA